MAGLPDIDNTSEGFQEKFSDDFHKIVKAVQDYLEIALLTLTKHLYAKWLRYSIQRNDRLYFTDPNEKEGRVMIKYHNG